MTPTDIEPFIGPTLAGWAGETTCLYLSNILQNRDDARLCRAVLMGDSGKAYAGDDQLCIDVDQLGATADLMVAPKVYCGDLATVALTVRVARRAPPMAPDLTEREMVRVAPAAGKLVPDEETGGFFPPEGRTVPRTPYIERRLQDGSLVIDGAPDLGLVIMPIGDSITSFSGAAWLDKLLRERGYRPRFTGTLQEYSLDMVRFGGPLGEGRPSWKAGEITNHVTGRPIIGGPGGPTTVAKFFAKTWPHWPQEVNSLGRAAKPSDDPADVVNGQVLDFGFYFQRFAEGATGVPPGRGVVKPTTYLWGFGTNEIKTGTAEEIEALAYASDAYFYRRVRAFDPSASIIRWMPGTFRDPVRDQIWTGKYIPLLKGVMRAIAERNDAGITLCPSWAFADQGGLGYPLREATPDPITGVRRTGSSGDAHPQDRLREEMFKAVAAYIVTAPRGA
ncbi:DUF2635 domain-containing protein [Mesorhizobium sp. ASY16-5R]|uniref:DUF2635 domain-containing protein n=1 Tax=Mesorhizobium sp. ASY16-5R TaxID=3445772 RepID=UPI003F9F1169